MNILQASHLIEWMLKWKDHVEAGRKLGPEEVSTILDHWQRGIDPWESAAAICEGRKL